MATDLDRWVFSLSLRRIWASSLQQFPRKSMLKSQIQLSQYDRCQTQRPKEFKQCRPFQIYQSALGFPRFFRAEAQNRELNRSKYENVVGLVAFINKNYATCFFHRAKYVDLQFGKIRPSITWIKYRTLKLVGFLVGCRKNKISLYDFGGKLAGKLERLRLCGELYRINDEPMFLKS